MVLLAVLLAVAGLAGDGPLADASRSSADGTLQVDYERVARLSADQQLAVRFSGSSGPHAVVLPEAFLDDYEVVGTVPEPSSSGVQQGGVRYSFDGAGTVTFHLQAQAAGRHHATLTGPGDAAVSLTQWVWP